MKIKEMFRDDITRDINGVIKVNQEEELVLKQELTEYVITKELNKHFQTFFIAYSQSFDRNIENVGVWIQGFFGSGKSHFLKMLSYLLENKVVGGKKTLEYFRNKWEDDTLALSEIEQALAHPTETILFNIDIVSGTTKDEDALKRVFQKMFYQHLGFYGENLQVAELEMFLSEEGKYETFQEEYNKQTGKIWCEDRKNLAFRRDAVAKCLCSTLGWSEETAKDWVRTNKSDVKSIAEFAKMINAYLAKKAPDTRLLFMIDEVGQYIGTDSRLLLNLQSIVEELGAQCKGKVWVVCTGQSALDDLKLKIREDEFSKIQARFPTRLALSTTSANEVIQKRLLQKTPDAEKELTAVYDNSKNTLLNLFTFKGSRSDICGFKNENEFVKHYPFVPYQFTLLQKVFTEVRQHGNVGKHLASGARSMLSGVQEAAKSMLDKNQTALVPFYAFYDTIDNVLDHSIRDAIRRCTASVANGIIQEIDVKLYKLLYLMRYLDDIPPTLDNLTILMSDNIDTDTHALRGILRDSLSRLEHDSYISAVNGEYRFLTNEEQDIQKDISRQTVMSNDVSQTIGEIIYSDIFTDSKMRHMDRDFPFNKKCDGSYKGNNVADQITLEILTDASSSDARSELSLQTKSSTVACVSLADDIDYYKDIETSIKIKKYLRSRGRNSSDSNITSDILRDQEKKAEALKISGRDKIIKAIEGGSFYVLGDKVSLKKTVGGAVAMLRAFLTQYIDGTYNKFSYLNNRAKNVEEILSIAESLDGMEDNKPAVEDMEGHLRDKFLANQQQTVADLQQRYSKIPFGWTDLDVAVIITTLLKLQKVSVKLNGKEIRFGDKGLFDALLKKNEIGFTVVKLRQSINPAKLRQAQKILTEIFEKDIPVDEDNLITKSVIYCEERRGALIKYLDNYTSRAYPGKSLLEKGKTLMEELINKAGDGIAFVEKVIELEGDLCDNAEDVDPVIEFIKNQKATFDKGVDAIQRYKDDEPYLANSGDAMSALKELRDIVNVNVPKFNYTRIPQITKLVEQVRAIHSDLLREKKAYLQDVILVENKNYLESHFAGKVNAEEIRARSEESYQSILANVQGAETIVKVDASQTQIQNATEAFIKALVVKADEPQQNFKSVIRTTVFPAKRLSSEADIDAYVEDIRSSLKSMLNGADGIDIK